LTIYLAFSNKCVIRQTFIDVLCFPTTIAASLEAPKFSDISFAFYVAVDPSEAERQMQVKLNELF